VFVSTTDAWLFCKVWSEHNGLASGAPSTYLGSQHKMMPVIVHHARVTASSLTSALQVKKKAVIAVHVWQAVCQDVCATLSVSKLLTIPVGNSHMQECCCIAMQHNVHSN
jgi:hypothetical protein